MEINEFYIKLNIKYGLRMGNSQLPRRADAKGSADIIYLICDAYRYLAGHA